MRFIVMCFHYNFQNALEIRSSIIQPNMPRVSVTMTTGTCSTFSLPFQQRPSGIDDGMTKHACAITLPINRDPYIIHLNIATCKWWLPFISAEKALFRLVATWRSFKERSTYDQLDWLEVLKPKESSDRLGAEAGWANRRTDAKPHALKT